MPLRDLEIKNLPEIAPRFRSHLIISIDKNRRHSRTMLMSKKLRLKCYYFRGLEKSYLDIV